MQQIYIDNEQLDIDIILQRQWGRYAELLLGTCGITDRCVCVCVCVCGGGGYRLGCAAL